MFHNFLKHYGDGKTEPRKPRKANWNKETWTTYEITVGNHSKFYDFSNTEEVLNDFLINVRSKFKQVVVWWLNVVFQLKIFNVHQANTTFPFWMLDIGQ